MIRLTPEQFENYEKKRLENMRKAGTVRTHRMRDEEVNPAKTPTLPVSGPVSRKAPRETASHSLLVQIELTGLPAPVLEFRFDAVRK